jgi:hypothetical protein
LRLYTVDVWFAGRTRRSCSLFDNAVIKYCHWLRMSWFPEQSQHKNHDSKGEVELLLWPIMPCKKRGTSVERIALFEQAGFLPAISLNSLGRKGIE